MILTKKDVLEYMFDHFDWNGDLTGMPYCEDSVISPEQEEWIKEHCERELQFLLAEWDKYCRVYDDDEELFTDGKTYAMTRETANEICTADRVREYIEYCDAWEDFQKWSSMFADFMESFRFGGSYEATEEEIETELTEYIKCDDSDFAEFIEWLMEGRCDRCGALDADKNFVSLNGMHMRLCEVCYDDMGGR